MDSPASAEPPARRLPRAIGMMKAFSKSRETQKTASLISSPLGPVKSSRGADLVRSDTLTIVAGIDSNTAASSNKLAGRLHPNKRTETGHMERSGIPTSKSSQDLMGNSNCSMGSSRIGKPAVISSKPTATSSLQPRSLNQKVASRRISLKPSISVPLLGPLQSRKELSATAPECSVLDENTPPPGHKVGNVVPQDKARPTPSSNNYKLPKSRTLGVLHELKASISRPGTVASRSRRGHQPPLPRVDSSPSIDSAKTTLPASATSSRVWLPHSSLTSLVRSSRSSTPEPTRPDQVTEAQPSEYWSGRFVALQDRFLFEAMDTLFSSTNAADVWPLSEAEILGRLRGESKLSIEVVLNEKSSQLPFSNKTTLPHANTTSSLTKLMFKPSQISADEDDDLYRRIFLHLEESCLNLQAKQSLQDWQHSYAKRMNRPSLLPLGRTMNNKGRVVRFFGGSSVAKVKHARRQSLLVPSLGKKGSGKDDALGITQERLVLQ